MVWLHADPGPEASMGTWLVTPTAMPPWPGQRTIGGTVAHHQLRLLAVKVGDDLPSCGLAGDVSLRQGSGRAGLLMRSGPQSADAAETPLPVGSPHCSRQVALGLQSMHACRCGYAAATCMRAPAAASRPRSAPWAAGPPPQSWAAPPRSCLPQQLAGRAGGTAPACSGVAATVCCLHGHTAMTKGMAIVGNNSAVPPNVVAPTWDQEPGAAHRSTTWRTPAKYGRGQGRASAAQTLVEVNGGPGGLWRHPAMPCHAVVSSTPTGGTAYPQRC